jgi:uncharacterized protein
VQNDLMALLDDLPRGGTAKRSMQPARRRMCEGPSPLRTGGRMGTAATNGGVSMTVVATGFWRRLDVPGHDAARVCQVSTGYQLLGQSVFLDPRGPAALRYTLDLTPTWATRQGQIDGFIGGRAVDTRIARTPNGWTLGGKEGGMADVVDLDLGFTPATNMVQLKRVGLSIGEAVSFDVAWLEAGDGALVRLPQEYRRVSEFDYEYSSPTSNYRATIIVAPSGFAAVYPRLWELEA